MCVCEGGGAYIKQVRVHKGIKMREQVLKCQLSFFIFYVLTPEISRGLLSP